MENVLEITDLSKICRICLKINYELLDITQQNVIEMLKSCSSVQISMKDKLPKTLCQNCYSDLNNAYNFKCLCEDSDKKLKEFLIKNEDFIQPEEGFIRKKKIESTFGDIIEDSIYSTESKDGSHTNDSNVHDLYDITQSKVEDKKNKCNLFFEPEDCIEETTHEESEDISDFKCSEEKITKQSQSINQKLEKKFECEMCGKKYCRTWELGKHMKNEHEAQGIECQHCSTLCYHKLHLDDHEKSHFVVNVFCKVCNQGFKNNTLLKRHSVNHSVERLFYCDECDSAFKRSYSLSQHKKRVHEKEKLEECMLCGKHIRPYYLEQHIKIHEERPSYHCNQCSKEFAVEKSLTTHIKRVHENEALKYRHLCNICGRGVLTPGALKNHVRSHTGEKPFVCDKCGKRYARRYDLLFHNRRAHLNVRPWVCTLCKNAYYTKDQLKKHMRQHTGEKPHSCIICGKSFGIKYSLTLHMKRHNINTS